MSLRVDHAGVLALLVDRGRRGYQHVGVSVGGPMDEHAYLWANRLLGNKQSATQIEITYGLFRCQFEEDTHIALTGANLQATLNDKPIRSWQTYAVTAGDVLAFKTPHAGLRSYLAVKGGFQVEPHLGSTTTLMRDHIGGLRQDGQALSKTDLIPFNRYAVKHRGQALPEAFIPDYTAKVELGVMLSYQFNQFDMSVIKRFFTSEYTISQHIDRMGYRLSGHAIHYEGQPLISEGISYGAIQISGDGQPIILMCDRQTIGGYPKVGCVTALDMNKLSQRGSGDTVMFRPIKAQTARNDMRAFERFFMT